MAEKKPRRKPALPRPSAEYILALKSEQQDRQEVKDQRDLLERIRELRNLERKVNIPERLVQMAGGAGPEFRNPAIADELMSLPAMFFANKPNLVINLGKGDEKKATSNATLREHFTTAALLEQIGCREPGASTFERLVDATFEGGGWTMMLRNRDVWEERYGLDQDDYDGEGEYESAKEDAKKKAGVPVEWVSLDAMGVLPTFEGTKLVEVVYVQKRSMLSTFGKYGLGLDASGAPCPRALAVKGWESTAQGNDVEFITHVNKEWITYLIASEGKAVVPTGSRGKEMQWRHGYGFVPVWVSYGLTKNYERGRIVTWSVSETKRYLVEYHSYLRTMFAYLAIRDAIPPLVWEVQTEGERITGHDGKPLLPAAYELGQQYYGTPGASLKRVDFADNAEKIQLEIAQADKDITALQPPKMAGNLGDLGGAGFAISSVLSEYKLRYSQIRNGIERHLKDATLGFWEIIGQIGEPVYLFGEGKDQGWMSVDADTFKDPAHVRWELVPETPSAMVIEERLWASRVSNHSADEKMMVEALGANWDEVRKGRARDRVMQTPNFLQAEEAEIWGSMARGEWLKANQQAEQMAAFTQVQAAQQGGAGQMPPTQDVGNMALSPNGAGAQPGQELQPGPGPGGVAGMPQTPTAAATAQVQSF